MTRQLVQGKWAVILAFMVLSGAYLLYSELAAVRISETHSGVPHPGVFGTETSPIPEWTYTP